MDEQTFDIDESMSEEKLKRIDDDFRRIENEGVNSILKYFDRILDKLFTFNNIMIAGYFALSTLNDSVSMINILIPIFNLTILIFIEYRLMEKSRFEADIRKKTKDEIDRNGNKINSTNLYSLLIIFTTLVVALIFLYYLLIK